MTPLFLEVVTPFLGIQGCHLKFTSFNLQQNKYNYSKLSISNVRLETQFQGKPIPCGTSGSRTMVLKYCIYRLMDFDLGESEYELRIFPLLMHESIIPSLLNIQF